MSRTRYSAALIVSAAMLMTGIAHAAEQPYPNRAIRLILPVAPGGGIDFIARLVGPPLSASLKQPIVVDNRPGAGNALGAEIAARAVPDGYTLSIGNNSTHGVQQAVRSKLSYDTIKDFTPITLMAATPQLLVASNGVPAKTVKEFIALAKAKPGQLNFGSSGIGSNTHLVAELFKFVTGIEMTHIPFKGTGPAFTALMGGEVQVMFSSTTGSMVHVQSGRLKALGIASAKRSDLVPDIPTMAEQGVTGFDGSTWYALLGPARLPKPIVALLNQEVVKIVKSADFKQKMTGAGAEAIGSTPEECAQVIKNELAKWTKLSKQTGLRIDD